MGASVQRIERLWRDVFTAVSQLFYRLFCHLENSGLLDSCSYHLYALHYVFLPRINKALSEFVNGWNKHTLSKTGGYSPLKLYTKEMIRLRQSNAAAFDYFDTVSEYYGTEEDIVIIPENTQPVVIPPIDISLTEDYLEVLMLLVDPLSESELYGVDLY